MCESTRAALFLAKRVQLSAVKCSFLYDIIYNSKVYKTIGGILRSYNTKNYKEDNGDTLVIGGKLEVKDGAEVKGLRAVNMAESTASSYTELKKDFNDLLTALKDGGLMAGDAWDADVLAVPGGTAQMPTPETIRNSAHATFSIEDNEITVALDCKVSDLEDADHGEVWGVHKWLGFGVDTGLDSIVGVEFNGTAMTEADAQEASDLGLSAGEFVLYIKAENPAYLTSGKPFTLKASGMEFTEFNVKITETEN